MKTNDTSNNGSVYAIPVKEASNDHDNAGTCLQFVWVIQVKETLDA